MNPKSLPATLEAAIRHLIDVATTNAKRHVLSDGGVWRPTWRVAEMANEGVGPLIRWESDADESEEPVLFWTFTAHYWMHVYPSVDSP